MLQARRTIPALGPRMEHFSTPSFQIAAVMTENIFQQAECSAAVPDDHLSGMLYALFLSWALLYNMDSLHTGHQESSYALLYKSISD